jgi:hypothetical protein
MDSFSRDMKPRTQGLHHKVRLLQTFPETKPETVTCPINNKQYEQETKSVRVKTLH